jgi:hypothetical protein
MVLILLAGLAQAHHASTAHDAPAESGAELGAHSDDGADECPHEAYHQHPDAECCLGLACVTALVSSASTLAFPGSGASLWPLAASAAHSDASEGQFRPPRLLLTV